MVIINRLKEEILDYFPCELIIPKEIEDNIQEIRIRLGQAITFKCANHEFITDLIADESIVLKLLENFTNNSVYAVQSEINSGFITIKGGHRIGISGTCVFENRCIKSIKYISSLNIRVAREIKDCSKNILKTIICNNDFENTIIISPPRVWKNNNSQGYDKALK